jgi:hypothetical protein
MMTERWSTENYAAYFRSLSRSQLVLVDRATGKAPF